jgi:hypothetical protein
LVTGLSQVQTLTSWHTSARSLTMGASMWASRLEVQIVWCGSNDVLTCARGLGRVSAEANKGNTEMIFIDENTDRPSLEVAAIAECNFDLDVIEAATDKELLDMITDWIEAGDETAGA